MNHHYSMFEGTGVALITPFTPQNEIDFDALANLLAYQAPHVDYYVVNGTTAESPTLTQKEKRELLDAVLRFNQGRKPVVFGMGGNNTYEIIEHIQQFDFTGVDAVLSVSPAYNRPSQEGIYQHYTALADALPVPLMLYNVPARTASNIAAETTLRLAQHPNICGVKEASGNLQQCLDIATYKPKGFLLLSGDDMLALPITAIGGKGVISVIANAFPAEFSTALRLAMQGKFAEAQPVFSQIYEFIKLIFEEGNPAGVKMTLELLGICSRRVRLPLAPASDRLAQKMEAQLHLLAQSRPKQGTSMMA